MNSRILRRHGARLCAAMAAALVVSGSVFGQGGQQTATARETVPAGLTGYWVSIVTEDWRYWMLTPPRGDYDSMPLNSEGRRVADNWDPAQDEAAGEECKAYGAAVIMRVPGRLHISWEDDSTLRIDTDAGEQTRRLHFDQVELASAGSTRQGHSVAEWEATGGDVETGITVERGVTRRIAPGGFLKVVTTQMRTGYLRKNGVPYSEDSVLTEYFRLSNDPPGHSWLFITTIVEDPTYLTAPFVTSTHFKKLADDDSGWNPTDCSAS